MEQSEFELCGTLMKWHHGDLLSKEIFVTTTSLAWAPHLDGRMILKLPNHSVIYSVFLSVIPGKELLRGL